MNAPPAPRRRRWPPHWLALACACACAVPAAAPAQAEPPAGEAARYVHFAEDFTANCVSRNGVQIQVKNTHPTRTLRVYLDRVYRGVGTGDRSRSELAPGAEPQPLGCSVTLDGGKQEWRLVRASFID